MTAPSKFSGPLSASLIQSLIAAGIRAPSGDNCQPWQFRLHESTGLAIDILPERAKSFFDFHHRATFLSVGAVIENLRTEAAWQGYGVEVGYPGGDGPSSEAALVTLTTDAADKPAPAHHQAMLERTVNRRPFFRKRPSESQLAKLRRDPVSGTGVDIYTDRKQVGAWARLIYLADRIRYSHPVIHEELFSKILLSREAIERERMGLEYDRLGIGPGGTAILKTLKPWRRMQRLSRVGVDAALSNQSRMLALSSGAIVLVTIPDQSAESWMHAGEQVERFWVAAHEMGLCCHPMTVALYLAQRYEEQGMKDFLPIHEPWLKEIVSGLGPLLQGRTGAMLFRLGSALKMSGTAIRLPVEEFLPSCD